MPTTPPLHPPHPATAVAFADAVQGAVLVQAAEVLHTVPCVGYTLQLPSTAGKLNIAAVRPLLMANAYVLPSQPCPVRSGVCASVLL